MIADQGWALFVALLLGWLLLWAGLIARTGNLRIRAVCNSKSVMRE